MKKFGDKVADSFAKFTGSWTFILTFSAFIMAWIAFNTYSDKKVDPFPYILLNLLLSFVAAVQAPLIMMSQNRQEERDRIRMKMDYEINVQAESEIEILTKKVDELSLLIKELSDNKKS